MAARAALRGGCGLLYAAVPACIRTVLAARVPEAITVALPEAAEGSLLPESAALLQRTLGGLSCRGRGAGLDTGHGTAIPFK